MLGCPYRTENGQSREAETEDGGDNYSQPDDPQHSSDDRCLSSAVSFDFAVPTLLKPEVAEERNETCR